MTQHGDISRELIDRLDGTLSFDPDTVDDGQLAETEVMLSRAGFLTVLFYVEGRQVPTLEVPTQGEETTQTYVGAEAIKGFLENRSKV